jgi:hypothetical protein
MKRKTITQKEFKKSGWKSWFSAVGNAFLIIFILAAIVFIITFIANH